MPKKQSQPSAKAQQAPEAAVPASPSPPNNLPSLQRLINIYSAAFSDTLASPDLSATLQAIKTALFNRDFSAAFSDPTYLEAYAARWSPTRSLGYASIFEGLEKEIRKLADESNATEGKDSEEEEEARVKMVCIGGCAAEHVAFASFLQTTQLKGDLTLIDAGPWSDICTTLQHHLTTPPTLSPYASASVKAANHALLGPSDLSLTFQQKNILSLPNGELAGMLGDQPLAVTLLFTLNELYTEGGIGKTTRFLGLMGEALASGSLLLVVDSPGSYSEAAVGKEKKRYPMHWLLDHTLLEKSPARVRWEKVESKDSLWYRLPEGLSYPIPLENMRYQMHLYRLSKDQAPSAQ